MANRNLASKVSGDISLPSHMTNGWGKQGVKFDPSALKMKFGIFVKRPPSEPLTTKYVAHPFLHDKYTKPLPMEKVPSVIQIQHLVQILDL